MFRTISLIEILKRMDPDVPITPRMLIEALNAEEAAQKEARAAALRGDPLARALLGDEGKDAP